MAKASIHLSWQSSANPLLTLGTQSAGAVISREISLCRMDDSIGLRDARVRLLLCSFQEFYFDPMSILSHFGCGWQIEPRQPRLCVSA
jgi:hypothetical protein